MGGSARRGPRAALCGARCPRRENAVCITARLGAVDGRRSRCDSASSEDHGKRSRAGGSGGDGGGPQRRALLYTCTLLLEYFTKTHAPRAVRPYHHHHQTRHTRRLLILTGMRLCEAFPRELRYGQRLCRSQCAPAADRPHTACRTAPPPSRPTLCFTRAPHGRGRTDSKSGAHRPARRR